MKTKLEVGMYVRTNTGIHKCVAVYTDNRPTFDRFANEFGNMIFFDEIIGEPSFKLNDLIREGDIISGRVHNNYKYINRKLVYFDKIESKLYVGNDEYDETFITNIDIDEILTKEQFEACKYEVNHEEINN